VLAAVARGARRVVVGERVLRTLVMEEALAAASLFEASSMIAARGGAGLARPSLALGKSAS
jgi:hypothetical protein